MKDLIERQAAIDALDEIRHALWEIDIPSPTVPEYIEHHEQIQSVWKLLDKKQKELYVLPSAQPEYEPVEAEDFAKMMSENSLYNFVVWHQEALTLMKEMGFVICKKTM